MASLSNQMTTLSDSCSTLFENSTITINDLESLLKLSKGNINNWLREDAPKYVAHIHCFKGEASDGQNLEGWDARDFLVFRSYLMCEWSTQLEGSNHLSQNQKLQTVIKLNLLAHWILRNSGELLTGKNIETLVEYVKTNSLLLVSGHEDHAVYILIKWEDTNDRYPIHIYNTGDMTPAHSKSINQCIYPFTGYINSTHKLEHYISGLLEAYSQKKRDAIDRIYSPLLEPFMAIEIGSYRGTAYKAQTVGNCVLASHNAFIADYLSSQGKLLKGFHKYELLTVSEIVYWDQNMPAGSTEEVRVIKLASLKAIPEALDTFLRRLFLNHITATKDPKRDSLSAVLNNTETKIQEVMLSNKTKMIYNRVLSQFHILLNVAEKGQQPEKDSLLEIPFISEIISDESTQSCRHTRQYFKFLKGVILYFKETDASIFNSLHGWQSDDYLPAVCFSDFLLTKQKIPIPKRENQSNTDKNLSDYFKSLFSQLENEYSAE